MAASTGVILIIDNLLSSLDNKIIARFINKQNDQVVGLSDAAKKRRKRRNVVTMKFNLINYVVETVGVIMCLVVKNFFVDLLYLLFNWCSTPLVYYLGMEENRNKAEEYIRSNTCLRSRPVSPNVVCQLVSIVETE